MSPPLRPSPSFRSPSAFIALSRPDSSADRDPDGKALVRAAEFNLLILGYQADESTTDTIILAHLDAGRRTITIVSIPRDTWVPVPEQGPTKINAAYAFGGAHMTARVASRLLGGVPIDAIVALQPEGAAAIVDAMGGLDVNVDENMNYDDENGDLHIHLQKGEQHLNGAQVAGYVRFRHDPASDFGRVKRQQRYSNLDRSVEPNPRIGRSCRASWSSREKYQDDALQSAAPLAIDDLSKRSRREYSFLHASSKAGWVGDASVVFADPALDEADRRATLCQARSAARRSPGR